MVQEKPSDIILANVVAFWVAYRKILSLANSHRKGLLSEIFLGDMNRHLLIPDRDPTADRSKDALKCSLVNQ